MVNKEWWEKAEVREGDGEGHMREGAESQTLSNMTRARRRPARERLFSMRGYDLTTFDCERDDG